MVLATPHLGHWDLGPTAIIQAGISSTPMLCFATFQGDPDINGYLNECRERMDVRVVQVNADDKRGPLAGLRTLRDGHGIGLLADQGPRQGYPAWFLGQAVIAHKGAGLLVKRSKKPLVVGCCLRASSNRSVTYVFPLPQPRPDASDEAIVQQAMDAMGRLIAAAPGQYFWHHKRFKRKIDHVGTPDQSYLNKLDMFYQENQLSHAN
jgi:KDO2-lipid IV(A) lauroyltransferase